MLLLFNAISANYLIILNIIIFNTISIYLILLIFVCSLFVCVLIEVFIYFLIRSSVLLTCDALV